ncbi:alpha,alpha-trehalose-phosphate synthase [UDP-forming] 1 [Spizellomyces punctatus DAOM BR117]|uniref:alpha,alpha-trehalose-phosphate synthase (UDP-forming) n=1 Tax=Spizellomyces punctatus (strain DAOM BR117) TaxID=645134 RepID=A0A0L0HCZ1_SPIPD|nr:alpha,alpha-trehalose-phosphate synthase [UDP-forming] 1 [Spizellomyces punctatus DAOM BR117]KNC98814.1 alpha,alpha-trehalose-phosphate synthase [UDP-forming] 1 [Spizellomyces punctatus DAOM BR117]|eukprot:XP_016606854.1 alpha,alpha-trehalose-phosphate synthase [UDP-forming] 1 [Spizellomyces punctatus DAOM BR117]
MMAASDKSPSSPVSASGEMSRLIVVSNRLPVTITKKDEGWNFAMSSGGLVSALSGLKKEMKFTWIGWPGLDVIRDQQDSMKKQLIEQHSCVPVFVSDELADMHYNGFSNSILWPLFHYHPGEINFNEDHWDAYQKVNRAFADAVADMVEDGDIIWVQDYHLMLLPTMLREQLIEKRRKNVKIGFFLHTPFPSSEIYRILPVRKQILLGVLNCDLIGFHTYDYARHFLSSCTRILGLHTMPNGVEFEGRVVHVGTFPIGIDTEKFAQGLQTEHIQSRIKRLQEKFKGVKLIVGVDRLDYIKGVPQKLHALELFLSKHPEWIEKVVLVQVAVPSRQDVEEYQHLQRVVNELVGRINGRFGTVEYAPIHFMHKSVPFDELVSLYAVADACLVSSTRDGMNLVSYEYIVSQQDRHGVLILSEFAGAAQSLNGSIIVNPWNTEELAQAIHDAVTMPDDVRKANHQKLYRYVTKYTAAYWGLTFVKELQRVSEQYDPQKLPKLPFDVVLSRFSKSQKKKIIFLDYDGTLTTTHKLPEFAKPSSAVLDALKRLSSRPDVFVYILSGRSRMHLDLWFSETGVGLSAEHGCFYRHPQKLGEAFGDPEADVDEGFNEIPAEESDTAAGTSDSSGKPTSKGVEIFRRRANNGWLALVDQVDSSWRDTIRPLFQHYTERTPGSFIEEKEINLTWHYRNADPEFGSWQSAELQVNLEKILSHMAVSIILGNKTLELRPSMVDKATAARAILKDLGAPKDTDYCLCVGDGKTDEVVFQFLQHEFEGNDSLITATVGKKQTEAAYYVETVKEVEKLISNMANME